MSTARRDAVTKRAGSMYKGKPQKAQRPQVYLWMPHLTAAKRSAGRHKRTSGRAPNRILDQDNNVTACAESQCSYPACQWALAMTSEFKAVFCLQPHLEPPTAGKNLKGKKSHRSLVSQNRDRPRSRTNPTGHYAAAEVRGHKGAGTTSH